MSGPATFRATVVAVHDGDTYTVDVLLPVTLYGKATGPVGFGLSRAGEHLTLRTKIRLAGYNAAELGTAGGDAAAAVVAALLPPGLVVTLGEVKADDYGDRWDATVTLPSGISLGPMLAAERWVAPYTGSGVKPVPPWPRTVS